MTRQSWQADAKAENVGRLRHAVFGFAKANGVPEPPLQDMSLAVTEAVTNAVVHAYERLSPGTITVEASIEEGRSMLISVRDDGAGMRPRLDSPGLGLGLALIGALATTTSVKRSADGRGTEVCMSFDYGATA